MPWHTKLILWKSLWDVTECLPVDSFSGRCSVAAQQQTEEKCFKAVNTVLLLPNPVCDCLNLLLSISLILCKSAGRQQLGSVLLSSANVGVGWGILTGSRVHITLLLHIWQEHLVCTHTKVVVVFIAFCCFWKWRSLHFGAIFFFTLCCLALLCRLVCRFLSLPSTLNSASWWFCHPLCQWLPLTEAAGSDVW